MGMGNRLIETMDEAEQAGAAEMLYVNLLQTIPNMAEIAKLRKCEKEAFSNSEIPYDAPF